jgi:hypothetical protein
MLATKMLVREAEEKVRRQKKKHANDHDAIVENVVSLKKMYLLSAHSATDASVSYRWGIYHFFNPRAGQLLQRGM